MFIVRHGRRIPYLFAPDEGGGSGDFGAEMDKIAAGYQGGDGGAGAASEVDGSDEPPAPPAAADTPTSSIPDPARVTDDMPYRDAKPLRDELAQARERWSPIEAAFSGIDDSDRTTLLAALPGMAAEDRATMIEAMNMLASGDPDDKAEVAEFFANAAEHIRGQIPAPPEPGSVDDLDAPMTRREYMAEQTQREAIAAENDAIQEILGEARDLGYDPDSTDPAVAGEFAALCEIARRMPDGDLGKAHEVLANRRQAVIDEYVASKTADAGTLGAPTGGASSTDERTLDTLDDAEAAMRARMDGVLGAR